MSKLAKLASFMQVPKSIPVAVCAKGVVLPVGRYLIFDDSVMPVTREVATVDNGKVMVDKVVSDGFHKWRVRTIRYGELEVSFRDQD